MQSRMKDLVARTCVAMFAAFPLAVAREGVATVTAFVTVGSSFDARPVPDCLRGAAQQRWVCRSGKRPTVKRALTVATIPTRFSCVREVNWA
jgi:hypothetical protein